MGKKAHFIEIDVILKSESKPWIVSRDNPNIPLMKISSSDFNLFKSGIFKSHSNKLNFNGKTFWLSSDFMNDLKVKSKISNLDISDLAISMQEYLNKDIIDNLNFNIDLSLFKPIINTDDDIYIICSKNTKNNFSGQVKKIEDKLSVIGLSVKKFYFVSETFFNRNDDNISYKKSKILLKHLLGLEIEDKIINQPIESYSEIVYYDDNLKCVETALRINDVLEKFMIDIDSDIKIMIKEKIKDYHNILIVKQFTHNNANKFVEKMIQLEFSNLIRSFENFQF